MARKIQRRTLPVAITNTLQVDGVHDAPQADLGTLALTFQPGGGGWLSVEDRLCAWQIESSVAALATDTFPFAGDSLLSTPSVSDDAVNRLVAGNVCVVTSACYSLVGTAPDVTIRLMMRKFGAGAGALRFHENHVAANTWINERAVRWVVRPLYNFVVQVQNYSAVNAIVVRFALTGWTAPEGVEFAR